MLKPQVNKLLNKEMDRKDFIKHVGVGLAALVGVSAMLRALNGTDSSLSSATTQTSDANYGGSAYGGHN